MKRREVEAGNCSPSRLRSTSKSSDTSRGLDLPLSRVDSDLVDSYVKQHRAEGASDHTISKEFQHLQIALRLATRAKAYRSDLSTLRPPDLHAGYEPRERSLTRERRSCGCSPASTRTALPSPAICIALGCRSSEAFTLLPTDIDLAAGKVHRRGGGTKTRESDRWVPILGLYRPLIEAALPYLPLAEGPNHNAGHQGGMPSCRHRTLLAERLPAHPRDPPEGSGRRFGHRAPAPRPHHDTPRGPRVRAADAEGTWRPG